MIKNLKVPLELSDWDVESNGLDHLKTNYSVLVLNLDKLSESLFIPVWLNLIKFD